MACSNAEYILIRTIQGDLDAFLKLLQIPHDVLLHEFTQSRRLTITINSIRNVINDWDEGAVPSDLVQQWASFIRRGYVSQRHPGSVQPVDIEYDPLDESKITSVIARLDEIGDIIDGNTTVDEVRALIWDSNHEECSEVNRG